MLRSSLFLTVMAYTGAACAQETKTGTLVPGAEPSNMVSGEFPVKAASKRPAFTKSEIRDINAARETMRVYTMCLVNGADTSFERSALVNFLKVPPQTTEAHLLEKKTENPDCLPTNGADFISLRLTPDLARGGIMRALYLNAKRSPPRFRVRPEEVAAASTLGNATFDTLKRFGACIVTKQRANAERFLTSDIGSSEELTTARTLVPTLNSCLEKGLNVHFSYGMLEGVLAEALFDSLNAAPAVAASKVKH